MLIFFQEMLINLIISQDIFRYLYGCADEQKKQTFECISAT